MYNPDKPTFNVSEPFLGVTTIQLNRSMVDKLIDVLNNQDGQLEKEIWAFLRALNDPAGCREMRAQKKRINRPIRPKYDRYTAYDDYQDDPDPNLGEEDQ